jgi:hypothetical protein
MFLIGSALPLITLALYMITVSAVSSIAALSIRIEDELDIPKTHSLARTYARNYLRLTEPELDAISTKEPQDRNLSLRWFGKTAAIILYVASLGQLGLFFLSSVHYNYRIF